MSHVKPHLWAELDAGNIPAARAAQLEAHADACDRCRAQRDRVTAARDSFTDIAAQSPPELEWDHLGARIYWTRSREQRVAEAAAAAPQRRWPWALGVAAAALGFAALLLFWPGSGDVELGLAAPPPAKPMPRPPQPAAMAVELAPASPIGALAVFERGRVSVDGAAIRWDAPIGEGARIETGADGRVALQFGDRAGLSLGPDSSLVLRTFDSQVIELVLDGEIDVLVTRRRATQQFAVVAGGRSVVVRGTGFRVVHRGGRLEVSCEHGRVDVTDGTTTRSVGASRGLAIDDGQDLAGEGSERRLDPETLAALRRRLAMPLLPAWSGVDAALGTSSVVSLEAERGARVEVDGRPIGRGALEMRMLSGRHHVVVAGSAAWAEGRWIEVGGGAEPSHIEAKPARERAGDAARRAALREALRRSPILARCLRRLTKHHVASGSFARFRIGINRDGSVRFVSVIDSNLGLEGRACFLEAAGAVELGRGAAVELQHRWTY